VIAQSQEEQACTLFFNAFLIGYSDGYNKKSSEKELARTLKESYPRGIQTQMEYKVRSFYEFAYNGGFAGATEFSKDNIRPYSKEAYSLASYSLPERCKIFIPNILQQKR
jgi:hypothetical protein